MDLDLKDKNVVVIGSSRGIGRAIAERFLREGSRVLITGRDVKVLEKTVSAFRNSFGEGFVARFSGDLESRSTMVALAEEIKKIWGFFDILVCNIGDGRSVPILQEGEDDWDRLTRANLASAGLAVRYLVPLLKKNVDSSAIIFVSSTCGLEASDAPLVYSVSKAALNAYAKNLSRPLSRMGIRVNTVCPGHILFPGSTWDRQMTESPERVQELIRREVPLGRFGTPEEIAHVVVFLSSPRASFVTGALVTADGGMTRCV